MGGINIESLAVQHVGRDGKGDKIEPEEQAVQQLGSMAVNVSLGTADHEGGGPPIITKANAGQLANLGKFNRTTSAVQAVKEASTRCDLCKFYDLDAGQARIRTNAADGPAIVGALLGRGRNLAEAEAEVRLWGFCKHRGQFTGPYQSCERFKPVTALAKAIGEFKTALMRAAAGKKGW